MLDKSYVVAAHLVGKVLNKSDIDGIVQTRVEVKNVVKRNSQCGSFVNKDVSEFSLFDLGYLKILIESICQIEKLQFDDPKYLRIRSYPFFARYNTITSLLHQLWYILVLGRLEPKP